MAEENGGKKPAGLIDRVARMPKTSRSWSGIRAAEELEGLKDPEKTQLYRSIFRVKHEDTPRSRSLGVLSNVFLHCTRPRSIETPSNTTTPGAWAASPFICSLC